MGAKTENRVRRQRERKIIARLRTIRAKILDLNDIISEMRDEQLQGEYAVPLFGMVCAIEHFIKKHARKNP